MKAFPPSHSTFKETQRQMAYEDSLPHSNLSDETLSKYFKVYFDSYRKTLEDFFPVLAPHLATYQRFPYKTTIVRWGDAGINAFHQSASEAAVEFKDISDINLQEYNFFDLMALFEPCWGEFDFSRTREYTEIDADLRGKSMALDDVLQVFWIYIATNEDFEKVCLKLIEAETAENLENKFIENSDLEIRLGLELILTEIAGFRRTEKWGFIFKHYKEDRITADLLHQIERELEGSKSELDIVCLVTSGDMTSIGRSIAVNNPKIRIWDRYILNKLVNKHLMLVGDYFKSYMDAVDVIAPDFERFRLKKYKDFEKRLNSCPPGKEFFAQYEILCKEILEYLFEGKLKPFDNQSQTYDGTQRRDIVFRNLRNSSFFQRLFDKFQADFVIFDPKNYEHEIDKNLFESIAKYPNEAIGKFAVLISRKGAKESVLKTQMRLFRDHGAVVLSLSDSELLEMVVRKEKEESPEDFLEDLLDQFLLSY